MRILALFLIAAAAAPAAEMAVLYFWKAKPGKADEYTRYVREIAEPIDEEARKQGAFVSVTTLMAPESNAAWTHLRIFVVKDQAQLDGLSKALDAATAKLEPDEAKRKKRGEYSATLRDFVEKQVTVVLK